MIFMDFHKAFDSIHRGKLMEILKAYGIPLETVNAISLLYKNTTAKVISPDGDTSFFPIHAGVLQGDTLAPYLFIIAVDYEWGQQSLIQMFVALLSKKLKVGDIQHYV